MTSDMIFLTRASLPAYEEYIEEIRSIWDENWITSFGPKHSRLETKLKDYLHCSKLALFTNGHSALEAALQAMNKGGVIITSPYTFASTTNAIIRTGYTPVFCDVERDTYTIDPNKIEELITEKTCAILPIHVYGNVCDVEKISDIAKRHGLMVIYDAAHAFGVEYKGKNIASFGDASVFSFHASKVFNTAEGGAVCYHDGDYGERLTCIRNFGLQPGDGSFPGGNGKMSELSAALGLCNLRHIKEYIDKRKKLTAVYYENLHVGSGISFIKRQENVTQNYAYMPICFDTQHARDRVFDHLHKHNVLCQKHFETPTNMFSYTVNRYKGNTPIADELSKKTLLLPLFSDMSNDQVIYVCELINDLVKYD